MTFAEQMAAKLKEARKNAQISATEAGRAVDRSDKTIYAWENNISEPSAEQLIALCRVYNVDISFFFPSDILQDDGRLSLTPDESKLVDAYRATTDFGRHVILKTAVMYRDELPRSAYQDGGLTIYEDMTDEEVSEAIERYEESEQDE